MAAQDVQVDIIPTGLWPQHDARDPLGIWGGREILTATGIEQMKVRFAAASTIAGAYVYTCYGATVAGLTATELANIKTRLLTNWPDIDVEAGVQGFATLTITPTAGSTTFTAPFAGPADPLIAPQWRYILLFDPRPVVGAFDIVELAIDRGVLDRQYAFECWGYYWDRGVLQAPGGPRHPGSN